MRFKCPSCGFDAVRFRSKANLVIGGKLNCPNCQTSLKTKGAATLLGVGITVLIMSGAPIFLGMFLGSLGFSFPVWVPFVVFIGVLVFLVIIVTFIYPMSAEKNAP